MSQKRFSGVQECGHCSNSAPMEIVNEYSQLKSYDDPRSRFQWEAGTVYELLLCPACRGVTLRSYYWHDAAIDPSEVEYKVLYPASSDSPQGLPDTIQKAYDEANKVKAIDVNAYGVLIGRLLELVCEDRNASGKILVNRLEDLVSKGEIPEKLVGVANSLRNLRNIGAHATLGELTPGEIPILDNLCKAILEYVYSAPFLVTQAKKRVEALKKSAKKRKSGKSKKTI